MDNYEQYKQKSLAGQSMGFDKAYCLLNNFIIRFAQRMMLSYP